MKCKLKVSPYDLILYAKNEEWSEPGNKPKCKRENVKKKIVKLGPKGPHVIKNKCLSEFMINEWSKCIIGY